MYAIRSYYGRLRYIGYSIGVTLVIYLAMAVLMALLGAMMPEQTLMAALPLVMSVAVIAILIVSVLLTIQRSHDFNVTGWLSLLLLRITSYNVCYTKLLRDAGCAGC